MCQKWFAKFCAGDVLLDDAPQLGRPIEVDSDQIETLIENSQCYTMQEIADILKISKSIVTGKNEKCIFYFMDKTKQTFWPTQYILLGPTPMVSNSASVHWGLKIFISNKFPGAAAVAAVKPYFKNHWPTA